MSIDPSAPILTLLAPTFCASRRARAMSACFTRAVAVIGDFLMPNGLVTKAYQFLAIGCEDLWVHWGANRNGGRLGFLPGSEIPPGTEWLKPGVPRDGWPNVMKEGRYAADGSVWERTIYLHSLVVAVGRPAVRLDQPICGTFAFKGKSCQIGQDFYRSQLKAVEAVVDGRRSRNMALAQFEMSSELVHGRNQYAWMAPKLALVGVFGQAPRPMRPSSRPHGPHTRPPTSGSRCRAGSWSWTLTSLMASRAASISSAFSVARRRKWQRR
jgi:hypothetical protein